jgi:hypothetical protein
MVDDDLLSGYRKVSSFALWDGESAVLRFSGKVDPEFVKTDSKGIEQHYIGVHVFLLEHSNENYQHLHNTDTIMRIGKDSTLNKWLEEGGLKGMAKNKTFKVDMSKALGYGLRIES